MIQNQTRDQSAARNGQSGFSVIEALIASVIVCIVSLAIANMVSSTSSMQSSMKATDELTNLIYEIQMAFAAPGKCQLNIPNLATSKFDKSQLGANPPPSIVLNQISVPPSTLAPIATNDAPIPGAGNTNLKMSLVNIRELTPDALYMADIQFNLKKDTGGQNVLSGPKMIVRTMPILLTTTAVGSIETIVDCGSVSKNLSTADMTVIQATMCPSMGGTWNTTTNTCTPRGASGFMRTGNLTQTHCPTGSPTLGGDSGLCATQPNLPPCGSMQAGTGCAPAGSSCYSPHFGVPAGYQVYSCGGLNGPDDNRGGEGPSADTGTE